MTAALHWRRLKKVVVLGVLAAVLLPVAAGVGASPFLPPRDALTLGRGAWSYFGDARSIAHGRWVFTGWISTRGDVWVARTDTRWGVSTKRRIYRHLGVDDHNNPSLVFWHGRLVAFFSEHSGRSLGRGAQMRYRVARARYSIGGFGPVRRVKTNTPGGLGYTYPNPVRSGRRLFLFWRGGDWNPTFSSTADLVHWAKARTLVKGPPRERPYAKYTEGPGDRFAMAFSDAHVQRWPNSLYYLEYRHGVFRTATGRRIGTLADVPFRRSQVGVVYRYRPGGGRAWPHDVAYGRDGRPVVVYTRRLHGPQGTDHFHWARFDGRRWVDRDLVSAGRRSHTFTSGGATLDHEDPRTLVLSRRMGEWNQVELWRTRGTGDHWSRRTLTRNRRAFSIRPVLPRFFHQTGQSVVVYFEGHATSFLHYATVVRMLLYRDSVAACRGC
jgi:hypothetical protein